MAVIGYARVSTADQHIDLQTDALNDAGAQRIFADLGVSGAKTDRPQLNAALDHVRPGDVLAVWKLDRLGRNTRHVLEVVETLRERGVGFRSLTEGLDTTGAMGKAMLTIMAAFATLERDVLIERTRAGLKAANARGNFGGRPRKADDAALAKVHTLKAKGLTAPEIARAVGVSRATVYRYLSDTTAV